MDSTPIKFLLVDDTPENLIALEALLRRDGLEILKATSGLEALELLLVHDVALALLDVQMPEMDGFELAELMRGMERTKNVPIIFVTAGQRDTQRMFKGYESGAVDFLYKPIEPLVLKGKADVFFELYKQRRVVANSLRLSEMFMGILGHDLRNPLSSLLTGAQLLSEQLPDERYQRTLRRMGAAGKRMTNMIEQLLDLTRLRLADGLGIDGRGEPVDVSSLVQRTVDELRGAHASREIVMDLAGGCTTMGDVDRLLQLLSNIVANALQHSEASSPVHVIVRKAADDILVEVSNKGVIPPQVLPTIFDPFRGREGRTSKSFGLGLGLYISQQIALAHGGSIHIDSAEGTGQTRCRVKLPVRRAGEAR